MSDRTCPHCHGTMHAYTGRRLKTSKQWYERYRRCNACGYRDKAIVEVIETVLSVSPVVVQTKSRSPLPV